MTQDNMFVPLHTRDVSIFQHHLELNFSTIDKIDSDNLNTAFEKFSGSGLDRIEDILQFANKKFDRIILDLKPSSNLMAMVEKITQLIGGSKCESCLVWAKSQRLLNLIHKADNSIDIGFVLVNQSEIEQIDSLQLPYAKVCGVNYQHLDASLIQIVLEKGYELFLWTLDIPSFCSEGRCVEVSGVVTTNICGFVNL
eukprot:TRINITY_DN58948_c0_g1_i4.p1 TRINITY_DN58948_c0_g1~~TRINITY_DN58948_c0_g1_i4.p1  ORF type:complete len:197 (+),score=15.77 TRINITY_DN58948_c0_g1_i4:347-937(+)